MEILSIIVGIVVATGLGFLWYSEIMFGSIWMNLTNVCGESGQGKTKMSYIYFTNLVLTFLYVYVILFLIKEDISFIKMIIVWAGMSLPIYAGDILWERKPIKLFMIKAGYGIVSFILLYEVMFLMN